ncbi:hypothetical protein CANFE03_04820 [Ligilactobacillus animalis]
MNNSFKFVNVNKLLPKNKFKGAIIGEVSKRITIKLGGETCLEKRKIFYVHTVSSMKKSTLIR